MDPESIIESQRAVRDETVLLIIRGRGIERRLRTKWSFLSDLYDDLRQDVYLRLLELWERPDKRETVRECLVSQPTLAAVVDMVVKEALRKYGREDTKEVRDKDAVYVPYEDMAEEVAKAARFLPAKERAIYYQWLESRCNTAALATRHRVSRAWMLRYIGKLNRKIQLLWEKHF